MPIHATTCLGVPFFPLKTKWCGFEYKYKNAPLLFQYLFPSRQIRFFLLQNRQGKTRLSKWYVAIEETEKRKIENEVHRLVTNRDAKFTNFVEVGLSEEKDRPCPRQR